MTATAQDMEKAIEHSKVVEQINILSQAIMQITDQTSLLALNASIEAVVNLSFHSNELLSFMSTDVSNDYQTLIEVAKKYNDDAKFVDHMVTDFSATSQELLAAVTEVITGIDAIAIAAQEGAEGTTDIANRNSSVNMHASQILTQVEQSKEIAEQLGVAVSIFKTSERDKNSNKPGLKSSI